MMEGFKIRQNQDLKICEKCCSFDKCTLKFNFKLFCRTLFCPDSILSKSYFDHKLNCPAAILTYSPFDLMLNCPMLFWPAIFCLTLLSPVTGFDTLANRIDGNESQALNYCLRDGSSQKSK